MGRTVLIGVTGPGRRLRWAWWATRWHLHRCRAEACYLTPTGGLPQGDFDGFVIGGGNDIDPAIYGGDVSSSRSVDPQRDDFELSVLELADQRGLPVFGICRGSQLLNVHAGGSLHGDLKSLRRHTSNRGTLLPRKAVDVDADSKLAAMLGAETARVNSLHHQSVKDLGKGLVISARDKDHIVQGIEAVDGPLRFGVQWHPEYMPQRREQRRLFASFVDYCRNRSSR
ncbi:MAG: gamma-glutamyl-gamma-aminobutyrate hydrolase family protein [Xanthomonadales bacterium]|nr:gamma-glutamyl-gamma-aminobutyrate hydrolase family protein [Xanthomonadales bacterium]